MKQVRTIPVHAGAASGRRARRRAETRERIFRCAMQLFAEHGFFDTTVEDITQAADVGKGTFFNYFPSKEHVLGVLLQIQLGKVAEAVAEASQQRWSIAEILHRLFLRVAEEPGRSRKLVRGLLPALLGSAPVRRLLARGMLEGRRTLAGLIQMGQERGEIRRDHPPEQFALAFQQALFGTLVVWGIEDSGPLEPRLEFSFAQYATSIRQSVERPSL
ncbi:MAG: TetR/AcrR family transcriptional regulator [Chlamydiota bacterium]